MLVLFDLLVRPILWLCSPRFREHQHNVKLQNAHLDRTLHPVADAACWYCRARSDSLRHYRGLTSETDPRVLP